MASNHTFYEYKCELSGTSRIISMLYATRRTPLMTKLLQYIVNGTECNYDKIRRIAASRKSDREIINAILQLRMNIAPARADYDDRMERQIGSYQAIFHTHPEILLNADGADLVYLDVGCNRGDLTKMVSQLLPKNWRTYGADIDEWDVKASRSERESEFASRDMTFVNIDYSSTTPIQLSGKVQLVTLSHMLHHAAAYIQIILAELRRLEVKYIILREHDCIDKTVGRLISVEHIVYATLNDGLSFDHALPMCYGIYKNVAGWDDVLSDAGYIPTDVSYPDIKSATRSYFRTYKRR